MLSADPIINSIYNTQAYNRFSYVWNNPLKFVDPMGYNGDLPKSYDCPTFKPDKKDDKTPRKEKIAARDRDGGSKKGGIFGNGFGGWLKGFFGTGEGGISIHQSNGYNAPRSITLGGYGLQQNSFNFGSSYHGSASYDPFDYALAMGPPGVSIRNNTSPSVIPYMVTRSDFSKLNNALTFGEGIFGAFQGLSTSQGYWLGINGKYYSLGWGGNQYTGSRAGALAAANKYKWAGRSTIVVTGLIGICSIREGYKLDGGKFGYNAQRAAASSVGGIGFGIAGAKVGVITGASIGGWFGGFGAIPGAVIGGVIGGFGVGIGGGYLGSSLVEKWYDNWYGR